MARKKENSHYSQMVYDHPPIKSHKYPNYEN